MLRPVPLSIIRSFSLYTQQTCMTYTITMSTVKNSWWWTEELSETCRIQKNINATPFSNRLYYSAQIPRGGSSSLLTSVWWRLMFWVHPSCHPSGSYNFQAAHYIFEQAMHIRHPPPQVNYQIIFNTDTQKYQASLPCSEQYPLSVNRMCQTLWIVS